jgi:hypothetical protein
MKNLIAAFLILLSSGAIAQDAMINDKNAQVRNVSGFNAIRISGSIDVYLTQGNSEAVAVSASEEKFRDRIKTEVVNGTLKIYYDNEKFNLTTANRKLRAYVSVKDINRLEVSGASDLKISGTLTASALQLNISGSSDLEGSLKVGDLRLVASGASDAKIKGSVTTLNVEASGASDIKGYDLTVDECTAKASGASDINLTVNKQISAQASGASSVYYKGDAVMKEVHTSGASSVGKKG